MDVATLLEKGEGWFSKRGKDDRPEFSRILVLFARMKRGNPGLRQTCGWAWSMTAPGVETAGKL